MWTAALRVSGRGRAGQAARLCGSPRNEALPATRRRRGALQRLQAAAAVVLLALSSEPAPAQDLAAQRQHELIRVVRQDCGSCHGLRLSGGLGPALTREALDGKPVQALAATIYHGRPGTPMPGWRTLLSEDDAQWIAQQLSAGFPEEPARREAAR